MTDDIELPPLPEGMIGMHCTCFDRSDMEDYARAAVIADRARRALQGLADADREYALRALLSETRVYIHKTSGRYAVADLAERIDAALKEEK
jgi:hypothetical protein